MNQKIIFIIVTVAAILTGTISGYFYNQNQRSKIVSEIADTGGDDSKMYALIENGKISLSPLDDPLIPDFAIKRQGLDTGDAFQYDLLPLTGSSTVSVKAPQPLLELEVGSLELPVKNTDSEENGPPADDPDGTSGQGTPTSTPS